MPVAFLTVADGLALAERGRARVSLAHPHSQPDAAALVQKYRDQGLDGIEAFYGRYKKGERERWLALAERYEMTATGGTDFHGAKGERGAFGVDIPPPWADKLVTWLR